MLIRGVAPLLDQGAATSTVPLSPSAAPAIFAQPIRVPWASTRVAHSVQTGAVPLTTAAMLLDPCRSPWAYRTQGIALPISAATVRWNQIFRSVGSRSPRA